MRRLFISALLVLNFFSLSAHAAPSTKTTYDTQPLTTEPDPFLTAEGVKGMIMPPKNSLLLAVGYAGGNYIEADEYIRGLSFVIRYAPLDHEQIVWDYQVDVNSDNLVGFSAARRWYCCPGDKFDPYARVSVGSYLDGKAELAGFVDLKRWRVRAAWGFGKSFNTEMGVGYALAGFDLYIQTGYIFLFE
ncbi:hypothetical protein D3C87_1242560 [compost metagenome]